MHIFVVSLKTRDFVYDNMDIVLITELPSNEIGIPLYNEIKTIPQLQNEEEDKAAFVKAMNKTMELPMENSLLCNEFHSMGIEFETVLLDEREKAIRRWI